MNNFIKKIYNWIINYWWIALICIMVLYTVFVSIINIPELNRVTATTYSYFNQLIAPLGVILGLILGYPLLKRKLIDNYITKQFEIIHDNNRIVRKECLTLKEKYPVKHISQNLNPEYLITVINDVKRLNELAIDANPDSYKYSYLLYKSLHTFSEQTKNIPNNSHEQYYIETLSGFVHNHLDQIYKFSKSIGFIPKNTSIKEKPILVSQLKKYVSENKYYQVEGIDLSLSNKHSSALLVTFFSITNRCLSESNGLLFKSCYKAAPSASPFARIMYNQSIYMPLVLEGEKLMNFLVPKLVLVGYLRSKLTKMESGISTHYLICHYANISLGSFVEGCIKDKFSLSTYNDTYIGETVFDVTDIEEFTINGESIIVKIEEGKAMRYFDRIKRKLCDKMSEEMRLSRNT
jgi:hypothetical protein